MLRNLLTALAFTGAERTLKRVVLTTGAKHYGVHLGPVKCPMEETDPWVEGVGRPPNFYYRQQRILKEMSETSVAKGGGGWDWVVTYPNDVLGVVSGLFSFFLSVGWWWWWFTRERSKLTRFGMNIGNFMNLVTALGVYAVICKELQEPFVFPGSRDFYTRFDSFTDSKLHARFCRWAALEPGCKNQAFNVVDGDVQSWQTLWPKLADRFGLAVPADQFKGQDEKVVPLIERPPVMEQKESIGLGEVKRGEVRMRIDLLAWADRDDVKKAWERVADREGLRRQVLGEATWFFLNFVLGRNYDVVISMSKARKLGFREEVDSWDALDECLGELEETDVLPKRR